MPVYCLRPSLILVRIIANNLESGLVEKVDDPGIKRSLYIMFVQFMYPMQL